jgi:hypothetical protein
MIFPVREQLCFVCEQSCQLCDTSCVITLLEQLSHHLLILLALELVQPLFHCTARDLTRLVAGKSVSSAADDTRQTLT